MHTIHLTTPTPVLRLPAHEQAARHERSIRPIGYAPVPHRRHATPTSRAGRQTIPYPNPNAYRPLWMDAEVLV